MTFYRLSSKKDDISSSDNVSPSVKLASEIADSQKIDSFSISGKVSGIDGGKIYLATGQVRRVGSNTEFVPETKTIIVATSTKIYKLTKKDGKVVSVAANLSDIKIASDITVHSKQNIFDSAEIPADEIDLVLY